MRCEDSSIGFYCLVPPTTAYQGQRNPNPLAARLCQNVYQDCGLFKNCLTGAENGFCSNELYCTEEDP